MKKKVIVSIIAIIILFGISSVQAVTGTANLKVSNINVKPGETFTITLSVTCEDGINGIDTNYNYDGTKLELVSANVANNNWANLGTDNNITIISNTTSKITSNDIYVLTFKVKEDIKDTTAIISTSEIMIDSDLAENSSFKVAGKSVNINIALENSDNGNDTENNNTGNNNNAGNTNTGNNNNEGNTNTDEKVDSISQNTETTDKTVSADKKLPQTGSTSKIFVIPIVIVALAVAIYSFIKIKNISKK